MAAASTLNSISSYGTNEEFPSQTTIDFWIADTQRGLVSVKHRKNVECNMFA